MYWSKDHHHEVPRKKIRSEIYGWLVYVAHWILYKFVRRIIVTPFEKGGTVNYTTLSAFLYEVNM